MNLEVVEPLVEAVHRLEPHLVVISGDLVENACEPEFVLARKFLDRLPRPLLVVPGNHDMPFYNPVRRLLVRLSLYKRYITRNLEPFYEDGEMAVMGVSTPRLLPLRGGIINDWQVERIERRLCSADVRLVRILVTHHPFDLDETYHRRELVGGARRAMARFARTIDVLLAGHMHHGHSGLTARRYGLQGQSAVFVQAGAATAVRGVGQPNAFNVLKVERSSVLVEQRHWNARQSRFECTAERRFVFDRRITCAA